MPYPNYNAQHRGRNDLPSHISHFSRHASGRSGHLEITSGPHDDCKAFASKTADNGVEVVSIATADRQKVARDAGHEVVHRAAHDVDHQLEQTAGRAAQDVDHHLREDVLDPADCLQLIAHDPADPRGEDRPDLAVEALGHLHGQHADTRPDLATEAAAQAGQAVVADGIEPAHATGHAGVEPVPPGGHAGVDTARDAVPAHHQAAADRRETSLNAAEFQQEAANAADHAQVHAADPQQEAAHWPQFVLDVVVQAGRSGEAVDLRHQAALVHLCGGDLQAEYLAGCPIEHDAKERGGTRHV